jgi:integrase
MTKPRRRQAGEGGISEYITKAGPRFLIKYTAPQDDGSKKVVLKRGYLTRKAAGEALREQRTKIATGTHVLANKVTLAQHLEEWLDSLRLSPSTVASYRKNARLHLVPTLGEQRLDQITGTKITALYRRLENSGRADGNGGLSARTVRYIHTILHSALSAAVRDGRLAVNPTDKAVPPSARQAASPEMHTWSGEELGRFLDWAKARDEELHPAWLVLAMTGMRRGEALALRWGDVDFDAATISVRRALTLIRNKGKVGEMVVGPPKSGKPRVVDVDEQTLAALRSYRAWRGSVALTLARSDAYVLGRIDGSPRQPEHFSRSFQTQLAAAREELGKDLLSEIRLHDLRHTHATLLLAGGVHPKIVSERLGHAKISITLDTYSHVIPTLQREAASKLAALVYGAS